ncbi:MAG: hypothetical protein Fur009_4350 [Candidatus Microgenomates bacterium]
MEKNLKTKNYYQLLKNMLTKSQIQELAKFYKTDEFTIKREYLQLVFLNHLYQLKESEKIFFKGGTAIRLLFNSPRFSEDLDFSTSFSKEKIKQIVKKIEKSIQKELPNLKILPLYSGVEGERFRIKYQDKDLKYPLTIRLDFHIGRVGQTEIFPITTRFPINIFSLVSCLSRDEILKEKIIALIDRSKGRDFFDVWFLLDKGIKTRVKIDKELLIKKIENYPTKKLKSDLAKFLPLSYRRVVDLLKEKLVKKIKDYL